MRGSINWYQSREPRRSYCRIFLPLSAPRSLYAGFSSWQQQPHCCLHLDPSLPQPFLSIIASLPSRRPPSSSPPLQAASPLLPPVASYRCHPPLLPVASTVASSTFSPALTIVVAALTSPTATLVATTATSSFPYLHRYFPYRYHLIATSPRLLLQLLPAVSSPYVAVAATACRCCLPLPQSQPHLPCSCIVVLCCSTLPPLPCNHITVPCHSPRCCPSISSMLPPTTSLLPCRLSLLPVSSPASSFTTVNNASSYHRPARCCFDDLILAANIDGCEI
ncbi:hypothetical protein B296_00019885 [Ensete ventricosum]|uniref:Uncharacterized protein n=1 Tax=Ensete ventricosum TaxID=4639 RepID=A0A427A202_ENSVE|nr:hypothetical protein B296_00019885 [Ensete ventricosum]